MSNDAGATWQPPDVALAGKLLSDPRYIARRYLRRWFALDLLATLPLDIMFGSVGGGNASDRLRLLAFLKVRRLPPPARHATSSADSWLHARRRGCCGCRACCG